MKSEDILTVAVRDFEPARDTNFVYDSWTNSYRDSAMGAWGNIPKAIYYKRERTRIDALIKRGAELKIACDPTDPDIILGFACAEAPVLHYVYVKAAYRRQGVALTLLSAVGLSSTVLIPCSHWTPFAEQVAGRRPHLFRRVDLF